MSATLAQAIAAAIIATVGLWWFWLVLKPVRSLPPTTRYGLYALIWLAYFVAATMVARMAGAT